MPKIQLNTSAAAWEAVVSMMDLAESPFISRLQLPGAAVVAGAAVVSAPQSPGPLLQVLHSWMGSRYSVRRKQELGVSVSFGKK